MTFSPRPLLALRDLWVANGGEHLGIVGGPRHFSGYHLGRDRIFSSTGQGGNDYSIQHHRDAGFLTNAASAIDLGRLNGTLKGLQEFSVWLVGQCRADPEAYRDVREVIYSDDGRRVLRWDGYLKRLFPAGDGTGQGDDSHTTHTHISFPRDSERRAKTQLFQPYFKEDIVIVPSLPVPQLVDLPAGRPLLRPDGKTPLINVSRAIVGVYSPAPGPGVGQRYVIITTGGVRQFAVVNTAGLTFRPFADPVPTGAAITKMWLDWVATHPK